MHVLARAPLITFVASLLGCGGGTSAPAHPPSGYDPASPCSELAKTCHGKTGEVAEKCHHLGHAGEASACSEQHDACLAACAQ